MRHHTLWVNFFTISVSQSRETIYLGGHGSEMSLETRFFCQKFFLPKVGGAGKKMALNDSLIYIFDESDQESPKFLVKTV